jgi:hypothetical protein
MKRYRLTAHISLIVKYCMLVYWENIFGPVMESGYGIASYRQTTETIIIQLTFKSEQYEKGNGFTGGIIHSIIKSGSANRQ